MQGIWSGRKTSKSYVYVSACQVCIPNRWKLASSTEAKEGCLATGYVERTLKNLYFCCS